MDINENSGAFFLKQIWHVEICVYVVQMESLEVILHLIKSLFYKISHTFTLNSELLLN